MLTNATTVVPGSWCPAVWNRCRGLCPERTGRPMPVDDHDVIARTASIRPAAFARDPWREEAGRHAHPGADRLARAAGVGRSSNRSCSAGAPLGGRLSEAHALTPGSSAGSRPPASRTPQTPSSIARAGSETDAVELGRVMPTARGSAIEAGHTTRATTAAWRGELRGDNPADASAASVHRSPIARRTAACLPEPGAVHAGRSEPCRVLLEPGHPATPRRETAPRRFAM